MPVFETGPGLLAAGRLPRVGIPLLVSDDCGYLNGETLTLPGGINASNGT
jgi:hypothetical protein